MINERKIDYETATATAFYTRREKTKR